jgi:hypothetical protein
MVYQTSTELSVQEFVSKYNKSIDWICIQTGADRRTVFRHQNNSNNNAPKYVVFRRHLSLLAQTMSN